jgi:hypothetical protein
MIKVDLLLETFQPNIILAALELNSIGVFDFIATPQYLNTPLIGMSQSLDDEMFDRCLEHGKCLLLENPSIDMPFFLR